ncbi:tRNA (guanine(26)-N(2))-dimethyltransferase isoform X2 [Megalopta genalis]|uniref:tRNA (guanine(26)-N(2))-dimethyltransferase isoform X2 n=1 Tax=Megalopta genalis TaxID=115081 RepID=UPI003FD0A1F1
MIKSIDLVFKTLTTFIMDDQQCAKKPKLENTTIREGESEILVSNTNVFYNPVQEFNRDLSTAVLTIYARARNEEVSKKGVSKKDGITILEALSATGLRSIRYAKEVPGIKQIIANDISTKAVESIKRNIEHNGIWILMDVQQYFWTLLFNVYLMENIASHAARYGRYIVPILSISVDFYIRVFVKVFSSQIKCKDNATKIGMVYQCTGCESLNTQPLCYKKPSGSYKISSSPCVDQLCKVCKHKQHAGGPIWLGILHDQMFVSELLCNLHIMKLETVKRIEGVLNVVHEELDIPLYYTLDRLLSIVRCCTPSMLMFRSALLNAGYQVSYSHANKISIKTDAPHQVIWDIVRTWEKDHPIKREKLPNDSPGLNILNTSIITNVSFDIHPLANPASRQKHLTRFQHNPTINWGPGTRDKTILDLEGKVKDEKKIKNQNKNAKKEKLQTTDNSEDVYAESA